MKRTFACACVLLTLYPIAWGQVDDEPVPKEAESAPLVDPFDDQYRRLESGSETDLEALRRHKIETNSKSLLEEFRRRGLDDDARAPVGKLIDSLGSPEFRTRERALDELIRIGPAVVGFLRRTTRSGDFEQVRRAEMGIDRIQAGEVPAEVLAAGVRVLGGRKDVDPIPTLLRYLPYADSSYVADEVRAALKARDRLDADRRGGAAHPDLVRALDSDFPARRAAAGEALAGHRDHVDKVRALLADADPLVRVRVAEAMVLAGEKSAVPVLFASLPAVPAEVALTGEDVLLRLAEGRQPPDVSRGDDDKSAAKFTAAWAKWWKANAAAVDLAELHKRPPLLGHTVVVLLDLGRVAELNARNEVVWQIEGLVFPLDVQALPNGNVLVAEYHANRVTERDRFRGEVKWQFDIAGPLVAQRLPNRHTFIANDSQIVEVDENKKEVFSFTMPGGERMMKVVKASNGDIVALTSDGRVVRMDSKGKQLSAFNVDLATKLFGGRLHVSPNGHVLVPHNAENKVVEYDPRGGVVLDVEVPQPVAAVRLQNGNVLATTMQPQTGAIEVDRTGREIWNYRQSTRVTRAVRR